MDLTWDSLPNGWVRADPWDSLPSGWVRADQIEPGVEVLDVHSWQTVTHSQTTNSGCWMLRFRHGTRFLNPAAPVAVRSEP
jgi:hypothetical protein